MEVEKLNKNLNIIQQLGTHPNQDNDLEPDELKKEFDKAALIIQQYLNEVIVPALKSAPKVLVVTVEEDRPSATHAPSEIRNFCTDGGYAFAKMASGEVYPLLYATENNAFFIGIGPDKLLRLYVLDTNQIFSQIQTFAPLDDTSDSGARTWSADKIIKKISAMIAQGGAGNIDMGERLVLAGMFKVGDPEKPRAEVTYDRDVGRVEICDEMSSDPVRIAVADGVDEEDAVNKGQLQPLVVTASKEGDEWAASHTSGKIFDALQSERKVFLLTEDGFFPCVLADDERAYFAQVNYEDGKLLAYHVFEDGSVEVLEKDFAFRGEVPVVNDNVVSSDRIWSSKKTVDKLCPSFEKTGTLVQCEPVEGYPLSVSAKEDSEIEGVTVTVCGKNLYNASNYPFDTSGYIYHNRGDVYKSDTSSYRCTSMAIPVAHLRGQTISIKHAPGGTSNAGIAFYDQSEAYISGTNNGQVTVPTDASFARFSINKDRVGEAQIEIGSQSTGYEPYLGERFEASGDAAGEFIPVDGVSGRAGLTIIYAKNGKGEITEVKVSGKADPVAIIEKLTNAVISLGGNV